MSRKVLNKSKDRLGAPKNKSNSIWFIFKFSNWIIVLNFEIKFQIKRFTFIIIIIVIIHKNLHRMLSNESSKSETGVVEEKKERAEVG